MRSRRIRVKWPSKDTTWKGRTSSMKGWFQALEGGMFGIPCFCNSLITLSRAGALSPIGRGSQGFDKTSPIAASMHSFDCKMKINKI